MIEAINNIWTEKYRPKTLNDIVLSSETRDILNKFKGDKSIPNLLLVGPPGVGKCIDGSEEIEITVSDEIYADIIKYLTKIT